MFDDLFAVDIQRSIHGLHLDHVHDAVSQYTRVCSYCTDIIYEKDCKIKLLQPLSLLNWQKYIDIKPHTNSNLLK